MNPLNHPVACFIERNRRVKELDKYFIGEWLRTYDGKDFSGMKYDDYIGIEVVLASSAEQRTWEAIQQSDHIWCQTAFIGENAALFAKMVRLAVAQGVHDKCFFNLEERSVALYQMRSIDPSVMTGMRYLEKYCGIHFFFWEEIWEQIRHPSREALVKEVAGRQHSTVRYI